MIQLFKKHFHHTSAQKWAALGIFVSIFLFFGFFPDSVVAADVTVDNDIWFDNEHDNRGTWGPIWTSSSTAYIVYLDIGGSGDELSVSKTVDGGATWSIIHTKTGIDDNGRVGSGVGVWFDKWTPGDTGGKIHIAYITHEIFFADEIFYFNIDTENSDTASSVSTIIADSSSTSSQTISLTKARNGNLYVSWWGNATTKNGFERSTDGGANWTSRTDIADGAAVDWVSLLPGNESDTEDIWAIYWDRSADEISLKVYDNSANSWSETVISSGMVDDSYLFQLSAVQRLSDNHIILAAWSQVDAATADLKVWDIGSTGSITAKANVITDELNSMQTAVFINQQTDDLYVAYLSGTDFWTAVGTHYKKSTDGGAIWGSEITLNEDAESDIFRINAGYSVGNGGGKFMPIWTDYTTGMLTNINNAVVIAASTPIITRTASLVTNTTATITWDTSEITSSIVDWGVTSTYSQATSETDTSPRVTSHSVALSSLVPCITYYYRVRSTGAFLNEGTGVDKTFTTTGCLGSSSVTSEVSGSITIGAGGTITFEGGSTLFVPIAFASQNATFQAGLLDRASIIAVAAAPTDTSPVGYFHQLSALSDPSTTITSFDDAITVSLGYSGVDMTGLSESSLKIYRWDGSVWQELSSCGVNMSLKTVTCTTTSFSVFGIFAATGSGGGGLPPIYFQSPVAPEEGFKILVNNGDSITQNRIVTLNLVAGSDISDMSISSNTLDLSDAVQEPFQQTKTWDMCSSYAGSIVDEACPSGTYTITVQFYTTYGGQPSPKVSTQVTYSSSETIIPVEVQERGILTLLRDLSLGMKGEDVQQLQEYLNNTGFLVAESGPGSLGNETIFFGSLTKSALIRFQNAHAKEILEPVGLSQGTGYFGASTRTFISGGNQEIQENKEQQESFSILISRNLSFGDTNEDVKILQTLLSQDAAIYPQALVTSYYGELTRKAVQRFQIQYGVVSSENDPGYGYVGPKTRAKLQEVFQ